MKEVKVTIIMCAYNEQQYIKETLEAWLNQSYKNFKLLIIDDASTDNTSRIINEYNDDRIEYIRNSSNLGIAKTLEKGISICNTEFLVISTANDIPLEKKLEREIKILETHPEVVLATSGVELINEKTVVIPDSSLGFNLPTDIIFNRKEFLERVPIWTSFLISTIRTKIFKEDNIKIDIAHSAFDLKLMLDISMLNCKMYFINDILFHFRIHDNQDSESRTEMLRRHLSLWNYMKDIKLEPYLIGQSVASTIGVYNAPLSIEEDLIFYQDKTVFIEYMDKLLENDVYVSPIHKYKYAACCKFNNHTSFIKLADKYYSLWEDIYFNRSIANELTKLGIRNICLWGSKINNYILQKDVQRNSVNTIKIIEECIGGIEQEGVNIVRPCEQIFNEADMVIITTENIQEFARIYKSVREFNETVIIKWWKEFSSVNSYGELIESDKLVNQLSFLTNEPSVYIYKEILINYMQLLFKMGRDVESSMMYKYIVYYNFNNIEPNKQINKKYNLWYENILNNRSVGSELKQQGVEKVILWGTNINTYVIMKDLVYNNIEVINIIDSYRNDFEMDGIKVIPFSEDIVQEAQLIIVTSEAKIIYEKINKEISARVRNIKIMWWKELEYINF